MAPWILIVALFAPGEELTGSDLTLTMHERFAYATMMRTALIHGDLDRGLRHARQLAGTLDASASDRLRRRVAAAAGADSLDAATEAVSLIGEACGTCHQERRVRVVVVGDHHASWRDNLAARMGRHIWAADRMWAGLVGHDLAAWTQGGQLLRSDPFARSARELGVPREQLATLTALAAESLEAESWEARAASYGRFLATCADCHETLD